MLFLSTHFSAFKTSLVRRLSNSLAHSLARKSKFLAYMSVWIEDALPDLLSILQVDFIGLP